MTQYKFTTSDHSISTWPGVKEAKEKRRKLLEAVFQRRREIYRRYFKKLLSLTNEEAI